MATDIQKFTFDVNFDEPEQAVAEVPQEEEVTLKKSEHEAAIEAAYQRGLQEGEKAGAKKGEEKAADAMQDSEMKSQTATLELLQQNIQNALQDLPEKTAHHKEAFADDCLRFMEEMMQGIWPVLLQNFAKDILLDGMREALSFHKDIDKLIITVHSSMQQIVLDGLKAAGLFEHQKIEVKVNDDIKETDCEIAWKDGDYAQQYSDKMEEMIKEMQNLSKNHESGKELA